MAKQIPKKLFFKIGEVCQITDTQPYVLRFWESEFPQLAPKKNRSGQRIYSSEDIAVVEEIKRLLYDEGYTIAGARKRLDPAGNGDDLDAGEAPRKEKAKPRPPAPRVEIAPPEPDEEPDTLEELRAILAVMDETDRKLSQS
jgi:DNA-binding transcriptional MerR regulator